MLMTDWEHCAWVSDYAFERLLHCALVRSKGMYILKVKVGVLYFCIPSTVQILTILAILDHEDGRGLLVEERRDKTALN